MKKKKKAQQIVTLSLGKLKETNEDSSFFVKVTCRSTRTQVATSLIGVGWNGTYMQSKKGLVTIYNKKSVVDKVVSFSTEYYQFFNGFRSGNRQIYLIGIGLTFEDVEKAFGKFEKSKTE